MAKKKIVVYIMLFAMSLSILSVNLRVGTAFALTGINGNVIDDDHAPRSAILTATGSSIGSYKAGWLPPVNTTGLVEYMEFYSLWEKPAVIDLLKDKTKADLESYDKAKNSSGPNAAYVITNTSYADGKGNTFSTDQIEIQGIQASADQRFQYAYDGSKALNYKFYVASIGVNGIIGITQVNENAVTNSTVTKVGISTINDYTVSFDAPSNLGTIGEYLVLYTTSTKENTLNALRSQTKAQLEALDTSTNRAKLIPASSVTSNSGIVGFKAGQLPYNTGTFSTSTNYNVFVVSVNSTSSGNVGVLGIAQAGTIAKIDLTPAQSEMIAPTEGQFNDFYVLFNKKMNSTTTAIMNVNDLLQSLDVVNGTEVTPISLLEASSGSVKWLRPDIAKISLPAMNLRIGDQLKLTYAAAVKDTLDVAAASPALSPAALRDDAKPIGRVIQPTQQNGLTSIVIRFNEKMSNETTSLVHAKDFAEKIDIITGTGAIKSTINLEAATVSWTGNIATLAIPSTTIGQGDLFRIKYTNKVQDFFGNPASNEGTSAPIGGAFDLSTTDIHASVLNELRKASGGRTPKIAVLTSGTAGGDAADTYYKDVDDTATGISYEKEFIRYGFDPIYIPVNNVNYVTQRNNTDNVLIANEATAVYFNGGDQFRHVKALFNDDGTDSLVLSSLKQIFYSGGVATGSSAGDHILSSPMHGGGDSYTDMNNNGMVVNTLSDATIGQGIRSGIMPGFGFISPYGTTDSHFDQRGRIGRLIVAMRETHQNLGFGVDENTSFIVSEGKGKAIGANGVFVVDITNALFSNAGTDQGNEFAATGIKVNYLSDGDQFDFTTKAVLSSKPILTPSKSVYNSTAIFNSLENTKVITTLADSSSNTATGTSSQFKLIYSKDSNTKGYKSGSKYTVSGMNLAINKYVSSISLDGLNLNPAFNLNTTVYNVTVEPSQSSVKVKALVDDSTTSLTLNGEGVNSGVEQIVSLVSGATTTITIVATPASGSSKTYTLVIDARPKSNQAALSDIQIDGTRLNGFNSTVTSYNVQLPLGTTNVPAVNATAEDFNAHSVVITPALSLPGTTKIEVTAEDGMTTKLYEVHFKVLASNNADLKALEVSSGNLSPAFASSRTSYKTTVSHDTSSLTVTGTVYDPNATLRLNDHILESGTASWELPLQVGDNVITLEVTAMDGSTLIYTILANRLPSNNADLKALAISAGNLNPAFVSGILSYAATVENATSSLTVTGTVYDPNATLLLNERVLESGAASSGLPLIVGDNTITLEVIAQDGTTKNSYTIHVNRLSQAAPTSGYYGTDDTVPKPNGLQILIGGVAQEQFATAKNDKIGDRSVTVITFDTDKIIAKLDKEAKKVLTIPVTGNSDEVIGEFSGKLVKAMEDKDAIFEMKTERATYTLPASQIHISRISDQLGNSVNLDDIKISIQIGLSLPTTVAIIEKLALAGKMTLIGAPVDFEVTATLGGKTVAISQFQSYVERKIAIPSSSNASLFITAVVLNADGTLTHVPTKIVTIDGNKYAVIHSLTNSSYSLVSSPKTFVDIDNHWSKQDVNEMAARLVVQGTTDQAYQPDKSITRAEFVAILVRALGLKPGIGGETPKDIKASDWYSGVIQTALSYQLISGYEDGTFRPDLTITRNEAAAIITRGLKLANQIHGLTGEEVSKQLERFKDASQVPAWARYDLAVAVEHHILQGDNGEILPDHEVTRAQTAAMARRLLQQANLIN